MMTFYMTPRQRAHIRRRQSSDRLARFAGISQCDVHVPLDVKEEKDAFVIIATLPGLEADDLNIEIVENIVEIRGEFKEDEEENYLRRERPVGDFHRRLRFSTNLESEGAEASLNNGILTLRIPKVEEERPKTIKVKTK